MSTGAELDWLAVSRTVQRATGNAFLVDRYTPLAGGDISSAYHVGDGRREFFVKLVPRRYTEVLEAEWRGLDLLREARSIRVPEAVARGEHGEWAFLVLEYLALRGATHEEELARHLAQLHRSSARAFGAVENNYIGRLPQFNRDHRDWASFWREERLVPQLEMAFRGGFEPELAARSDRLLHRLDDLLDHLPRPSLLHGDLWHGNAGYLKGGEPVIFDPAVYFGDREAELAMCSLFGGFGESFYAAYHEAWPLPEGHRDRRPVYQLYHLLNHLNHFGESYLPRCVRLIDRLL